MRKKEAIIYISKTVFDNWDIPSTNDKRGVNSVFSDNVFAIIHHLVVRLNIPQQAAMQQLERRKLIQEEVCSQATRSKRISGIRDDKNKKNNRKGFKNLIINDEGYSFHRIVPHETESYDIFIFQGDSRAVVKPNKLSKLNNPRKISKLNIPKKSSKSNTSKKLSTVKQAIKDWLSTNENEVHTLKSFLALDVVSTFNILIPYFPNRAIKGDGKETNIFEKYEGIKNKHELMPDIFKENKGNNAKQPVASDEIKAVLVHFPYQNTNIGSNTQLNYLSAIWLTCHKTRLNYLLYFKDENKIKNESKYSILIRRTSKSLIVNLTQTIGTGRRTAKILLKATVQLPTVTPKKSSPSINELPISSIGCVIDIDVSDHELCCPFENHVKGISPQDAAQHIGKWLKWINRYANLDGEFYNYYHQLSPSDVAKYNAMAEFKQNPFTVFPSNPIVLPLI
jgi:hypothetical protein